MNKKKQKTSAAVIAWGVIGTIVALVTSVIVNGLTFAQLWEWFVQDKFHAPALSTADAIGLVLVVNFVINTNRQQPKDDKDTSYFEKMTRAFIVLILRCGLILLIGALVHSYV